MHPLRLALCPQWQPHSTARVAEHHHHRNRDNPCRHQNRQKQELCALPRGAAAAVIDHGRQGDAVDEREDDRCRIIHQSGDVCKVRAKNAVLGGNGRD